MSPHPSSIDSTFHAGERYAQERAGMREKMAELGPRVIRDYMPEQHRSFFAQLPFLLVGSVDARGQPWASIVTGAPGFVQAPDERRLTLSGMRMAAGDPLRGNLHDGAPLGLLGIEPHTRRRNRANGVLRAWSEQDMDIAITQSFGNCPKYIQARQPELLEAEQLPATVISDSTTLTPAMQALVRAADTFFIATAAAGSERPHGVDVSHRGGKPGFVRVDGDASLCVPDFVGNSFFNTIGNLLVNAQAGLLFADFASGALLYLAVHAEVIWDGPEVKAFAGAQRLLRLQVQSARLLEHALPLRWSEAVPSPFLDAMGSWR
ncbi:pyridoxamine 5'-phosphate oxidase family protein [Herbaspirillum sp. NPDC087042]|uniref:pyridoxamine 5'-phosphate oxidase family protein n=1 Tax=Herbaspirillum sp. NPDC087042 TaxID=3364004 RepID=UPI0037F99D36